jgi:hypothetical protein
MSVRADLPLVAGNFQIAQEFLHGDAHVVMIGDSEQNGLVGLYPSTWQVDKWSGIVAGPNLGQPPNGSTGTYEFGFSQPFMATDNNELADTTDPVAAGAAPGETNVITFAAQTAPPAPNLLYNRILQVALQPNQNSIYHGGSWADSSTGTLHADAIVYANPNGLASGVEYDVDINSNDTPAASTMMDLQSATPGLVDVPLTFPSQAWTGGNYLNVNFRIAAGATPVAGSNFVLAAERIYNGQPGFQLADVAFGGEDIDYFTNGANNNLGQYLQLTDSNIAYIWIGQNDTTKYDGAQFKQRMETLIGEYKAARPGMKFVLVSTYDTGHADEADYAQDLYDIAQSDPSVLFLNMYEAAGSFAFLNANYLQDTVHENLAGDTYMANLTQTLLADADGMAVKLPGDANLDGVVDSADFALLASHYGQTGAYLALGDFNGDGTVNALDFNALANNYGKTLSQFELASSVVPEPSAGLVLLPLLFGLTASRRTRFLAN